MDFAFILDPLPALKAYKDTSIAMMRALVARGHRIFALEAADLYWTKETTARVSSRSKSAGTTTTGTRPVRRKNRALADFAAVLMRKDPPFDMEYVYATYLLEAAERAGARVFNRPRAIRDHNEKMAIAGFTEFVAPTLVTRDAGRINAFIDAHGDVILKPLDGMGGTSHLPDPRRRPEPQRHHRDGEPRRHAHGDGAALHSGDRDGDKRVILIAGEPVPHALARIPKPGETRGNLAAGGRGVARALIGTGPAHRRGTRPGALGAGPPRRRTRRHRREPHRSQRDEPDLLCRDHRADGVRRRRHVRRRAGARLRVAPCGRRPRRRAASGRSAPRSASKRVLTSTLARRRPVRQRISVRP